MRAAIGTPAREALQGAITAIAAAGCETPRLDAEVLLAHVLGVSRERLMIDDLEVIGPAVPAFRDAVRRRSVEREPVAYITGRKAFRTIELHVDSRVLIPRPETELLVEVGLSLPLRTNVLDLCAGSGAVALALSAERPDLRVWGSDVSADALAVARENGERLGIEVQWLQSDLLASVPADVEAVLCNPPYVAERDRALLPPEVVRHEPAGALFAGPDGLSVIERLLSEAALRPQVRLLAVEIGAGQADAVAEAMLASGFATVERIADLAGIERVMKASR